MRGSPLRLKQMLTKDQTAEDSANGAGGRGIR
jgi:hypothetical protein